MPFLPDADTSWSQEILKYNKLSKQLLIMNNYNLNRYLWMIGAVNIERWGITIVRMKASIYKEMIQDFKLSEIIPPVGDVDASIEWLTKRKSVLISAEDDQKRAYVNKDTLLCDEDWHCNIIYTDLSQIITEDQFLQYFENTILQSNIEEQINNDSSEA